MFLEGLIGAAASVAVGFGLKKAYEGDYRYNITAREFQISAILISCAVAPIVVYAGYQVAIQQNVSYQETWSGWEQKTVQNVNTCYKDGTCHFEYSCDPETETYKDSDGKTQTRTKYHDCPYFTEESELSPEKLLGAPTATINSASEVSYTLPQGKLGELLWKYQRVCMRCDGKDGASNPGYVYLLNQVQPDGMQKILIVLVVVAASGVVWYVVLRY